MGIGELGAGRLLPILGLSSGQRQERNRARDQGGYQKSRVCPPKLIWEPAAVPADAARPACGRVRTHRRLANRGEAVTSRRSGKIAPNRGVTLRPEGLIASSDCVAREGE